MLCEGVFLFIFINFVFYKGFFTKWYFYLGLGWGESILYYICYAFVWTYHGSYYYYIIQLGLPVPIVAIAAGIANEHYGSDNGLVYCVIAITLLCRLLIRDIF